MPVQTSFFDQNEFNTWLESAIACNYPDKNKWPEFIERALCFKSPDYLPKIGCLSKAEWLKYCDQNNLVSSWTDKYSSAASLKQEILESPYNLQAPGLLPLDKRLWEISRFSDSDLLISLHCESGSEFYQRRFQFLLNKITGRNLTIGFVVDLNIDPVVLAAIFDARPVFKGPKGGLFRYSKSGNSKIYL